MLLHANTPTGRRQPTSCTATPRPSFSDASLTSLAQRLPLLTMEAPR